MNEAHQKTPTTSFRMCHAFCAFGFLSIFVSSMVDTEIFSALADNSRFCTIIGLLYLAYLPLCWFFCNISVKRFWCFQLAGFSFAFATAGFTRTLWRMGLEKVMVYPSLLSKFLMQMNQKPDTGFGRILFFILVFLVLYTLLAWLCIRMRKRFACVWFSFSRTMMAVGLLYFMKYLHAGGTTLPVVQYWIFVLLDIALLCCMVPKKKNPLFFGVYALGVCTLGHVLFEIVFASYKSFKADYNTFCDIPLGIKTKLQEKVITMLPAIEDPVSASKIVMGVLGALLIAIPALVLFLRARKFSKNRIALPLYCRSLNVGGQCAMMLMGVSLNCLNFSWEPANVPGYVLMLWGMADLTLYLLLAILNHDKKAVRFLLIVDAALIFFVPLYMMFAEEVTFVVAAVILGVSINKWMNDMQESKASSGGGGGGSFAQRVQASLLLKNELDAIDTAVSNGASEYEARYAAWRAIDSAKELGAFGFNDKN